MRSVSPEPSSRLLRAAVFTYALALVILVGLYPFGGSSEAREAQVARIMLESGEFVLPSRNGLVPSKPPLFHWLAAGSSVIAGAVSERAVRAVSVLAGTIVILLAIDAVRLIAGTCAAFAGAGPALMWLVFLILGTLYGFVSLLGDARVDMVFAAVQWVAVWALLRAICRAPDRHAGPEPPRELDWVLFFLAIALAVLAKGPLGVVLPALFGAIVLAAAYHPSRSWIAEALRPRVAILFFVVPVAAWYWLAWQLGGERFVARQLLFENVTRLTGGAFINDEPWWYYLATIARAAAPWSLIALWCAWSVRPPLGADRDRMLASRLTDACGLMVVGGIAILSVASGKRHSYLLPLYPPLAIYTAVRLYELLRGMREPHRAVLWRALRTAGPVTVALLALAAGALTAMATPAAWPTAGSELASAWVREHLDTLYLVILPALALVIMFRDHRAARPSGVPFPAWGLVIGFGLTVFTGLGIKNHLKAFPRAATEIQLVAPKSTLHIVRHERDEYLDPLLYYLAYDGAIERLNSFEPHCGKTYLSTRLDIGTIASRIEDRSSIRTIYSFKQPLDLRRENPRREIVVWKLDC